ncbi:MAG: hypothetical protein ABFD54_00935 [Armatimonadota bacterium]|nr:hypothetical protein [bacterium]
MIKKTVHVVANSHIDPVWLWDKFEGIDEVINTFRSACDRLDEYPKLKFSASSLCFYKWAEEFAPELFSRIKAHVASGRWEITGGWWVETDCNLPLAQSFYKSAELSRNYARSKFRVDIPVAYCPDSFGHAASLPEILADTGSKYYVFVRPNADEKPDLPSNLFYWEHGGKRVLCYRLRYHYSQGFHFSRERVESEIKTDEFYLNGLACYFFGLGDHGGGPTKREIETIQNIQKTEDLVDVRFSTCLEFFQAAEKLPDIPTYTGDLHYHAVGCYSVNRNLKNAVRGAERSLCYTGRVMDQAGMDSASQLDLLWESTIFNQFHDIMPGSCAPHAAVQAMNELGGVRDASETLSYTALKALSAQVPVRCLQGEFRIFNSLSEPVTGPFEIESFMYFRPGAPFKDTTGQSIRIQEIPASVMCANRRWMFIDAIPAHGMKSYYFDSEAESAIDQAVGMEFTIGNRVALGDMVVESPGQIIIAGSNLFKSAFSLGVIEDDSDTWSHGVRGYGAAKGCFAEESSSIYDGDIASFLISRQRYGDSRAELRFTLYKDLPFVDLFMRVHWEQERSVLKMEFEPNSSFGSFFVQGPGAAIEKSTDGAEEPLHGWLMAGELGISQDGAFAVDRQGDKLRITLIRSSIYGYDKYWRVDPKGPINHTDLGEHEFRLRFVRQQGLKCEEMEHLTRAFVEPFRVIRDGRQ